MYTMMTNNERRVNLTLKTRDHLQVHSDVWPHLRTAIGSIQLCHRRHTEVEVDMGQMIGWQKCVPAPTIGLDDQAHFVLRKGRMGGTRTVSVPSLDILPVATSYVTLILDPDREDRAAWRLVTAWIGKLAKPEPWDLRLDAVSRPEAIAFWSRHALIVGSAEAAGRPYLSTWRKEIARAQGLRG